MDQLRSAACGGVKKLAYPISTKTGLVNDGYYIHMDFISSKEFIQELNKSYEATDEILKHIICIVDEEV